MSSESKRAHMLYLPADHEPIPTYVDDNEGAGYLGDLQAAVKGLIEVITPWEQDRELTLWGNDEGRFADPMWVNVSGTMLCLDRYGYTMVGDMIATGSTPEGETCGLSQNQKVWLADTLNMPNVQWNFDHMPLSTVLGLEKERRDYEASL